MLFRPLEDWEDKVLKESLEKDSSGKLFIKSAGIGFLDTTIIGCAIVGAITMGIGLMLNLKD